MFGVINSRIQLPPGLEDDYAQASFRQLFRDPPTARA
jgi:hypothetical protein